MDMLIVVKALQVLVFLAAVSLLVLKYIYVRRFRTKHRQIDARWILWYDTMDILGTASQSRKSFMQTNNKLSTAMWICVLIGILLSILPF
jgi:hypothetical protein